MIDWTTGSSGRRVLGSVRSEFLRYKLLAEQAIEQVRDDELSVQGEGEPGAITTICWHVGGNLRSRFTDFLTSDGEKPDRNRDMEFVIEANTTKQDVLDYWERGWACVFAAIEPLQPEDFEKTVMIRGEPHTVVQAINRQLTHYSYHIGQIVFLAKHFRSTNWTSLSIPRNQSAAFNSSLANQQAQGTK